ncbi:unnamed protein product, partial [Hapterophycus canaliculatus]
MRRTNRGDVPAPHVAPTQAKSDPADDVVFDAGSLSFVQDWVADGGKDGGADAAAAEVEPEREDPRKTNPNRRLGVGAQPRKAKQERPEPSALEKKMLRKRQRQELSDAIAGEMDTHGVVNDDEERDGESKTASFKKSKTKRTKSVLQAQVPIDPDTATITPAPARAPTPGKEAWRGGEGGAEEAVSTSEAEMGPGMSAGNTDGDKQGRKRKARRKKSKGAATEVTAEEAKVPAGDRETPSERPATAVEQASSAVTSAAAVGDGENGEDATAGGSKKQRRGWGKARSKSAVASATPSPSASAGGTPTDNGIDEGERNGTMADERRQRKKTRSKQKNIRKDKRPMEQRPAHVRVGDPEFSGRGLTDETRKFLGLPEQKDFGDAPPAGWGQPGKTGAKPGWVIDKKPRRLPKDLVPDTAAGDEG